MKRKTEKFLTVVGTVFACAGFFFIGAFENWTMFILLAGLGMVILSVGAVINRM